MTNRSLLVKDIFENGKQGTWEDYAIKYDIRDAKTANDYYRWFIKNGSLEGEWEPGIKDIVDETNIEILQEEYLEISDNYLTPKESLIDSREFQEFLNWKLEKQSNRDFTPGTYAVMGCTHVPFHNRKFFQALLNLYSEINPTGLILAGDFMEMSSVSGHEVGKKPLPGISLGYEYEEGNKALDLLDNCNDWKIKHYLYGNHCFTEDTELLTEKGWVDLKDYLLEENVKFASYNRKTDTIEYDKPIGVTVKKYDGKIHNYNSNKINIAVTPEHKMLCKKQGKNKNYRFDLSKNIKNKCTIFKTAINNHNKDYDISDNDLKIAAWIHSDGSIIGNSYNIYQSKIETTDRIETLLIDSNINYSKHTRNRDIKEIDGKVLKCKVLPQHNFYIKANEYSLVKNKYKFENWVFKLSKRQVDIFINELVLGDGSKHKSSPETSWVLYGIKEFLDQVQLLCIQNGYSASISKYRDNDFRLNITVGQIETKLNSNIKQKINFSEEDYSGHVWCPTTKNGTVVCRRNGKVSIQGNCDRFWRHIEKSDPAKYGSALINPTLALRLNERGYNVQEKWKEAVVYLGKHLEVVHGENCSQFATKKSMDLFRTSLVFFHTHRFQAYMEGNTAAWNLGWGGDINSDCFNYATKAMKSSWKNASGIIIIDELGGYHVQPIVWHNDRFYFNGKQYN